MRSMVLARAVSLCLTLLVACQHTPSMNRPVAEPRIGAHETATKVDAPAMVGRDAGAVPAARSCPRSSLCGVR